MPRHLIRVGERLDRAKTRKILDMKKEIFSRKPNAAGVEYLKSYLALTSEAIPRIAVMKAVEPMRFLGKKNMMELRKLLVMRTSLVRKLGETAIKEAEKMGVRDPIATEELVKKLIAANPAMKSNGARLIEFFDKNRVPEYMQKALLGRVLEYEALFAEEAEKM